MAPGRDHREAEARTQKDQDQGKRFEVVVSGTLTTTSGEVVHDWVRAGKGIALKADWDLQPELREGSIVPCLGDYWCDEINLFALAIKS